MEAGGLLKLKKIAQGVIDTVEKGAEVITKLPSSMEELGQKTLKHLDDAVSGLDIVGGKINTFADDVADFVEESSEIVQKKKKKGKATISRQFDKLMDKTAQGQKMIDDAAESAKKLAAKANRKRGRLWSKAGGFVDDVAKAADDVVPALEALTRHGAKVSDDLASEGLSVLVKTQSRGKQVAKALFQKPELNPIFRTKYFKSVDDVAQGVADKLDYVRKAGAQDIGEALRGSRFGNRFIDVIDTSKVMVDDIATRTGGLFHAGAAKIDDVGEVVGKVAKNPTALFNKPSKAAKFVSMFPGLAAADDVGAVVTDLFNVGQDLARGDLKGAGQDLFKGFLHTGDATVGLMGKLGPDLLAEAYDIGIDEDQGRGTFSAFADASGLDKFLGVDDTYTEGSVEQLWKAGKWIGEKTT